MKIMPSVINKFENNTQLLIYCTLSAFIIFSPIVGLVFPEFAYFFKLYGNLDSPTLLTTLNIFSDFSGDWYRPISFALAPLLLGIDFHNPSSIGIFNIFFFSLLAYLCSITFLEGARLSVKILAASIILTAPALQSVSYFPVIDALYIIFGILSILALEKAHIKDRAILSADYGIAFFFLVLALGSKEVGILAPIVAPIIILTRQANLTNNTVSWRMAKTLALYCLPLILFSFAYYGFYLATKGITTNPSNYSTVPTTAHITKISKFFGMSLNIFFPAFIDSYLHSLTSAYDRIDTVIRLALYSTALFIFIHTIKQKPFSSTLGFFGTMVVLVIPLGLFSLHPHHTLPIIVLFAIGVSAMFSRLYNIIVTNIGYEKQLSASLTTLLIIISITLMHRAHLSNTNVLSIGIHGFALKYNTMLFYDQEFKESLQGKDTFLLVEECPSTWAVGSFSGVTKYYGRPKNSVEETYVARGTLKLRGFEEYFDSKESKKRVIGLGCYPESTPPYKIVDFSNIIHPVRLTERVNFALHGNGVSYLANGWLQTEDWGTWSDGADATIFLPLEVRRASKIIMEVNQIVSPSNSNLVMEVKINGMPTAPAKLTADSGGIFEIVIPAEIQEQLKHNRPHLKIEFHFPNVLRPADIRIVSDERKRAIGLVALTVQ